MISDPVWGPSTSGRRSSDTTRAKASSSSSATNSNSVSPPRPPRFPDSAVLASLAAGSLDEALGHVLLEALSTVEGFRDASEESWSELMRRPTAPLLDGGGGDDPGATTASSSSSSWSRSSSDSSSDAAAALVSSLCSRGRPRDALRALRAAHALGAPPNRYVTYQDLISACCRSGDVRGATTAYRLLQRAPAAGLSSGLSSSSSSSDGLYLEPNFVTTCGLISALSRASKSARKGTAAAGPKGAAAAAAHALWRELVDDRSSPASSPSSSSLFGGGYLDASAIITGMNACVGAGEIDEAWELLRRVLRAADLADAAEKSEKEGGGSPTAAASSPPPAASSRSTAAVVRPSVVMFNVLLKGAARQGNTRLLPLVLGEMRRRGVAPTRVTLNTLVSAHARAGELDLARAALDESSWVDSGSDGGGEQQRGGGEGSSSGGGNSSSSSRSSSGPDTWALAALASGYVKAGRRREAEDLYGEAMRAIAAAEERERERGGGGAGGSRRGEEDEEALFAPSSSPSSSSSSAPGAAFFTALIDGAAREGDAPGAQRWFDALVWAGAGSGVPPSARAFNVLLRAYCSSSSSSSSSPPAPAAAAAAAAVSPPRASPSSPRPYFASSSPSAAARGTSSVDPLSGALVGALRGADAAAAAVGGDAGLLAAAAKGDDDAPGAASSRPSNSPLQPPPPPLPRAPASSMEGVLRTLRLMGELGVRPEVDTYNTLMAACLSRGHAAAVPRLFRALLASSKGKESGRSSSGLPGQNVLAPDTLSWTTLIAALSRLGRADDAARAFEELELAAEEGSCAPPDAAAAAALVDALSRGGSAAGAAVGGVGGAAFFSSSSPSSSSLFSSPALSAARRRALLRADALALAAGLPPPPSAWGAAVAGASRAGDLDGAVALLADFVARGGEPDGGMLDAVAAACVRGPSDVRRALQALREAEGKVAATAGADARGAMKRALAALIARRGVGREEEEATAAAKTQRQQQQQQQQLQQQQQQQQQRSAASEGIERLKFWLGLPNRYYDEDGSGSSSGEGGRAVGGVGGVGDEIYWSGGGGGASAAAAAAAAVPPATTGAKQARAAAKASASSFSPPSAAPAVRRRERSSSSSFGGGERAAAGSSPSAPPLPAVVSRPSRTSAPPSRSSTPPPPPAPTAFKTPWSDDEEDDDDEEK